MAVTQKDIAERLRLSRSLVAGVLGNRAGIHASEETRRRVFEAAREMNYRPNAAARALRMGKTGIVSLCVLPEVGDDYEKSGTGGGGLESLIETLAQRLGGRDCRLQIEIAADRARAQAFLDEMASSRGCDAVVLWGDEAVAREFAPGLQASGVPFVTKGYYDDFPSWPQFDFDHARMMERAVSHLAEQGHTRLAYIGHDNEAVYAAKLRDGFDESVRRLPALEPPCYGPINAYDGTQEQALKFMRDWLHLPASQRPTGAVLSTNDYACWNACEIALAEVGRLAGNDAPDGFALCGLHSPRTPLLFGHAHAFDEADFDHLTGAMCERLLFPLLDGQPLQDYTVRAMSELHPLATLELHRHEAFAFRDAR